MVPTTLFLSKCGVRPDRAATYSPPFAAACVKANIISREQVSAFVAQCMHESRFFSKLSEDLDYTPERLMIVWPSRFPTHDMAAKYAHNPQALGNFVYAGRLGNGQASTNEGWLYRGSGLIEVTGKSNFAAADTWLGSDYVKFPQKPQTIAADACMISAWFWHANNLSMLLASPGGIDAVSHKINPFDGRDATANRHDLYSRCLAVSSD